MLGLDYFKLGVGAIVGAILAAAAMYAAYSLLVIPAIKADQFALGKASGAEAERTLWQKAMDAQRAKNDADRQAAQAQINAIEKQYLDLNSDATTRASRISDLEQQIAKEQQDNAAQARQHPGYCPPAFSRDVLRSLNRIGAAAGSNPAGSSRPVR